MLLNYSIGESSLEKKMLGYFYSKLNKTKEN